MEAEKWFGFLTVNLAGVSYRSPAEQSAVVLGALCRLEREPDNEHDANAIRVMVGTHHVGYVPSVVAAWLAVIMDNGWRVSARVKSGYTGNGNARIVLMLPRPGIDTEVGK